MLFRSNSNRKWQQLGTFSCKSIQYYVFLLFDIYTNVFTMHSEQFDKIEIVNHVTVFPTVFLIYGMN